MSHIHYDENLSGGDVVIVNCSHQCNVRVMDDSNYESYRRGGQHEFYGGGYARFPARIPVPHSGHWNVTLDLGGGSATIRHSVNYLKR